MDEALSDTVGVHLYDDFYEGEGYSKCTHKRDYRGNLHRPNNGDYVEISREQFDRWEAAMLAYQTMQGEIGDLLKARQQARHG